MTRKKLRETAMTVLLGLMVGTIYVGYHGDLNQSHLTFNLILVGLSAGVLLSTFARPKPAKVRRRRHV